MQPHLLPPAWVCINMHFVVNIFKLTLALALHTKNFLLTLFLLSTILVDWLDADVLGCFKFLVTEVDLFWVEAQQKCEEIGGYLAEPRTLRFLCKITKHYSTGIQR